eukprot:TRINITY_DN1573_c0_g1_i1.p1 TRINITY_DN1573_c0_g1~~TRINITY_DN1573_c0_g1_i1.p1  ORF type:complete len:1060 (+),score=292.52 TRINITY_DN1573_c0_g1_i1:49-3180(+)
MSERAAAPTERSAAPAERSAAPAERSAAPAERSAAPTERSAARSAPTERSRDDDIVAMDSPTPERSDPPAAQPGPLAAVPPPPPPTSRRRVARYGSGVSEPPVASPTQASQASPLQPAPQIVGPELDPMSGISATLSPVRPEAPELRVPLSVMLAGYGNAFSIREAGGLPTVWRRKVEWGLRSGFAALLSAALITQPGVYDFLKAAILVPIFGIVGVQAHLGSTLMFFRSACYGCVVGTVLALLVLLVIERIDDVNTREGVGWFLYTLSVFVLVSRPTFELTEAKLGAAVLSVSIFLEGAADYELAWYFPLNVLLAAMIGCASSLVAVLLPFPVRAARELRSRSDFQSRVLRSLLASQDLIVVSSEVSCIAHAEQLLCVLEDNVMEMKRLLIPAEMELLVRPSAAARVKAVVQYFDQMLPALRGRQATLRSGQENTEVRQRASKITMTKWMQMATTICAVVEEVIRSEREKTAVDQAVVAELNHASDVFLSACEEARREVMYKGGRLYVPPVPGEDRAGFQMKRSAAIFYCKRLTEAISNVPNMTPTRQGSCCSSCRKYWGLVCVWFRMLWHVVSKCPDTKKVKEAIKKTVALGIAGAFVFLHSWRNAVPQRHWVAVTICFIFTENVGSSLNTGMLRIGGTLLGSLYGLYAAILLGRSDTGFAISLAAWVALVSLFRGAAQGYLALCAAFTAPIIMVGTMTGAKDDQDVKEYAMQRIQTNTLGVLIFVVVENVIWPNKVRSELRKTQQDILTDLRDGLSEAMLPWVPPPAARRGSMRSMDRSRLSDSTPRTPKSPQALTAEAPTVLGDSRPPPALARAEPPAPADTESPATTDLEAPKQPSTSAKASHGVKAIAACQAQLLTADAEPALWRPPFPRHHYALVLQTELAAMRIVCAMHEAIAAVPLDTLLRKNRRPVPGHVEPDFDVPDILGSYVDVVHSALSRACKAWARSSDGSAAIADEIAADVAAPFSGGLATHANKWLEDTWATFTLAEMELTAPRLQEPAVLAMHAVCFLCLELTAKLERVGEHLRAVRAQETTRVHF